MDGNRQALRIAVPLHARSNRREEERVPAAMPLRIAGAEATTQDFSASGLSFVSTQPYPIGARVQVLVEYLLDGHNYPLECEVEVMRVAPDAGGYLVGARLLPQAGGLHSVG